MPKVTIVNNKLTIQTPKYSPPRPVKCNCSAARAEEACDGDSLPEIFSMDPTPFEFYRCCEKGYHSAVCVSLRQLPFAKGPFWSASSHWHTYCHYAGDAAPLSV